MISQHSYILSKWHYMFRITQSINRRIQKFIGKCNYMTLPSQYLWDTTSLQQNFLLLLFLALQSLVDLSFFHNCPLLFQVLRLTSLIPYIGKSLLMLGCLCCFQLQKVFKIHIIFLWGGVVSLMPNPKPGGPGYPVLSGSSP